MNRSTRNRKLCSGNKKILMGECRGWYNPAYKNMPANIVMVVDNVFKFMPKWTKNISFTSKISNSESLVSYILLLKGGGMKNNYIKKYLSNIIYEVQSLVDVEFNKFEGYPPEFSALDQQGLRDGSQIVTDYLQHGEYGLALEHIIYMIEETGIAISESVKTNIEYVAEELNMQEVKEEF